MPLLAKLDVVGKQLLQAAPMRSSCSNMMILLSAVLLMTPTTLVNCIVNQVRSVL